MELLVKKLGNEGLSEHSAQSLDLLPSLFTLNVNPRVGPPPEPLPRIHLTLKFKASQTEPTVHLTLLDTGCSSHMLVCPSIVPPDAQQSSGNETTIRLADGRTINTGGYTRILLMHGVYPLKETTALIVPGISEEAILGIPLWDKLNMVFKKKKGVRQSVDLEASNKVYRFALAEPPPSVAYCKETTTLEPGRLTTVQLSDNAEQMACLWPDLSPEVYSHLTNKTVTALANNTEEPIILEAGDKLFQILHAQEDPTSAKVLDYETIISEELPAPTRRRVKQILNRYQPILSPDPGLYKGSAEMEIKLTSAQGFTAPILPIPLKAKECYREWRDKMLELGVLIPGKSQFLSNLVTVPKSSGGYRFTINCKWINSVTMPFAYPLPKLEEILRNLSSKKWMACLDISKYFDSIRLRESACKYFAFTCPESARVYCFQTLPQGWKQSPHFAQFAMKSEVTAGIEDTDCYIDDILVRGDSPDELVDRVEEVLSRLKQLGLNTHPGKIKVGYTKLDCFGFTISYNHIVPSRDRIDAILRIPDPQTRRECHRVAGMLNYYRSHLTGFAALMRPLYDLLGSKEKFVFSKEATRAFEKVKTTLADPVALALPFTDGRLAVNSDSSLAGWGATLSTRAPGGEVRIVDLASGSWAASQRHYAISNLELLAVAKALLAFEKFLMFREFDLLCDNSAVTAVLQEPSRFRVKRASPMSRALLEIGRFDFKPHLVGTNADSQVLADLLSRTEPMTIGHVTAGELLQPDRELCTVDFLDVPLLTHKAALRRYIADRQQDPTVSADLNLKYSKMTGYKLEDDVHTLFGRVIVPNDLIDTVVEWAHMHLSPDRSKKYLKTRDIFIPQADRRVTEYASRCETCQVLRRRLLEEDRLQSPLRPSIPLTPFSEFQIDFIIYSDLQSSGKQVLTMVDLYTKFAILRLSSMKMSAVAHTLVQICVTYSISNAVCRADNQFNTTELRQALKPLGVEIRPGTPYNSRSQSQVERLNRSVREIMRVANPNFKVHRDVEMALALTQFTLNASPNKAGVCPAELVLPHTGYRLGLIPPPEPIVTSDQDTAYAKTLAERLNELYELARPQIDRVSKEQPYELEVNDLVRISTQNSIIKKADPLFSKLIFIIIAKEHPIYYVRRLDLDENLKGKTTLKVHRRRLKVCDKPNTQREKFWASFLQHENLETFLKNLKNEGIRREPTKGPPTDPTPTKMKLRDLAKRKQDQGQTQNPS